MGKSASKSVSNSFIDSVLYEIRSNSITSQKCMDGRFLTFLS